MMLKSPALIQKKKSAFLQQKLSSYSKKETNTIQPKEPSLSKEHDVNQLYKSNINPDFTDQEDEYMELPLKQVN